MRGAKTLLIAALILGGAHMSARRALADDPPPIVDGWGLRADREGPNYLELSLSRGESFTGFLYLVNMLDQPLTLDVIKVAGITAQRGGLALGEPAGGFNDWVDFDRARYEIEPVSFEKIPFTITIPADAPDFEHVGGFVAQLADDSETESTGGVGVKIIERSGVPLIVTVGAPSDCAISKVNFASHYRESGDWVGIFEFMIAGNVHFNGAGRVEVARPASPNPVGAWDLEIGYSPAGLPLLYPIAAPEPLKAGRYEVTGAIWSADYEDCGIAIDESILITPAEYQKAEQARAESVAVNYESPPTLADIAPAILSVNESGELVLNLAENVPAGVGVLGAAGVTASLVGGAILWAIRPSRVRKNRR